MSNTLQERYWSLIGRRAHWELKQRMYSLMRRDGLRRVNRPWPKAADSHFPLIDMQINQIKPFWMNQVFSGERLADFVAMQRQLDDHTEAAADYFNFELKYNSQGQFRYRLEQAFDRMGLRGRGIFKAVFNPRTRRIVYRAVDPLNILMDQGFDDFADADDFVEIQTLTVDQYKREQKFNQTPATISAIRGKADWILAAAKLEKQASEGVTHSNNPDRIILWNIYKQMESGWMVETRSPSNWDVDICQPHYLATEWQGETLLPFYSLTMEVVDEGWYAPRGIGELCAQFEAWLCKCWNDRADAMTLTTKPILTSDQEIPNIDNLRVMPGEVWPGNLKAVQMPSVSSTLMEEVNFTRSVAEQRAKAPDFGQFAPDEVGSGGNKPITATQSRISAGLQQVGADHDGETLRSVRMMPIYKHIWALKVQYHDADQAITYFIGKDLKDLPMQVVHDNYFVIPAGSGGTKHDKLQRALQRFTLLYGKPNVNNDELVTDVLAADDSRLVKRILLPANVKAGNEAEAEAMEIAIMLLGFPAQVNADEDHALRIKVLVGFIEKQHITAETVKPGVIQNIQGHLQEHMRILQQQQPQAAKMLQAQVMQMIQGLSQPQGPPQLTNGTGTQTVPPGANGAPPAGPAGGSSNGAPAAPKSPSESISVKLTDLYPSERAQALKMFGIVAAQPDEMYKTEQARANLKAQQPTPEPKIASLAK